MLIEVTEEDIKQSRVLKCSRCPIEMALDRVYPHSYSCVIPREIYIADYTFKTTEEVRAFINDFDSGRQVSPITFEIDYTLQKVEKCNAP
jgi:hypothetical protein